MDVRGLCRRLGRRDAGEVLMPGKRTALAILRCMEYGYTNPSRRTDRCSACRHSYVPPKERSAIYCRMLHGYVASGGRCDKLEREATKGGGHAGE